MKTHPRPAAHPRLAAVVALATLLGCGGDASRDGDAPKEKEDLLTGIWRSEQTDEGVFWFVTRPLRVTPGEPAYRGCLIQSDEAIARRLFGSDSLLVWERSEGSFQCTVIGDSTKQTVHLCGWEKDTCTPSLAKMKVTMEFAPGERDVAAFVIGGEAATFRRVQDVK